MSNNAKNLPEVKLGQYKGLAVTRHVRPLSEKTIDQEMVHQTRMRSVYHNLSLIHISEPTRPY